MLYVTTKEVADRFGAPVSLVCLWCQNGLVEAKKVKGRWRIDATVLEDPPPILRRRVDADVGDSKSEMGAQALAIEQGTRDETERGRLICDGFYRCPKCRREVTRTDVDWVDAHRPPGTKSWKEGGKLKCSHCGYEADPTPKLLMWLDPWYAQQRRKQVPQSIRRQALEEAGYRCTRCGATKELVLHHKREAWMGGSNELRNLQVLCRHCHMQLDGRLRPSIEEQTKKWLTVDEVVNRLGVKPATVVLWCEGRTRRSPTLKHTRRENGEWLISDVELRSAIHHGRIRPKKQRKR